jgi:ABC-type spermidine/putrescine transport system permease subunit II
MWGQVRSTIDPTIAAVATMLSAVTLVVLSLVMVAQRRARATR